MKPKVHQNWLIAITTAILIGAGVLFGYWIAGGFNSVSDDWVHPIARGVSWWEILTALGVPAAIAIALFSDWRTHRRFTRQMQLQSRELIAAKSRQRDEWRARRKEGKAERNVVRKGIREAILAELEACLDSVKADRAHFDSNLAEDGTIIIVPGYERPVFEKLGNEIVLLHPQYLNAIATQEPAFNRARDRLIFIEQAIRKDAKCAKDKYYIGLTQKSFEVLELVLKTYISLLNLPIERT